LRAVFALAGKDLRLLVRSRGDLFFTLGFPLLIAIFFGVIFAGPPGGRAAQSLVVVDEDLSPGSRDFTAGLAAAGGVSVVPMATATDADQAVRQGRHVAYVMLPPGFGAASQSPFFPPGPRLELGVDPSRKAEAAMIEGLLMRQAAAGLQRALRGGAATSRKIEESRSALAFTPGRSPENTAALRFLDELSRFLESRGARDPGPGFSMLRVDKKGVEPKALGPRNSFDFTFPQGILWGVLGCASTFGIGLVAERSAGTLVRLSVAPLSRPAILAGKALACLVAILTMETLLIGIGMLAFHLRPLSYPLLGLAAIASAVAFVGIMMALSTLGQTEKAASGAGWAILLVMSMLGGGMVPLFVMPAWMATASNASPVKWAILAFEGALWRGFGFAEMLGPCAILVAIGVTTFALGARRFRPA
jgi:linearmycin/streptolysin S transport system permease protein